MSRGPYAAAAMLRSYLRLLRDNRNFRLLWLAQVVSELGDWFYALAIYNLLLELTGNRAQAVGLAVVLQVLPHTLVAPTAGVVNDRISRKRHHDRRRHRRASSLCSACWRCGRRAWSGWSIRCCCLETIGAAFFEPAHSAVIPNIVPESDVLPANALASITWSFCLAVGASLGGVVGGAAGTRRGLPAECSLVSGLGMADPPHAVSRSRTRRNAARCAPANSVDFSPILEGAPLHPRRPPSLRDGVRERRHRPARREQRAAADPRPARLPAAHPRPRRGACGHCWA